MEQNDDIKIESLEVSDISEVSQKKKNFRLLIVILLLLLGIGLTIVLLGDRLKEIAIGEDEVIELFPGEDDMESMLEGSLEELDQASQTAQEVSGAEGSGTETGTSNPVRAGGAANTLYAEMITQDSKRTWSTMTHVDIFDDFYTGTWKAGTHDDVTVESDDGENVIAPGTDGYYTFWIKNTGQVPMDYQVSFESKQNYDYGIPMEFRLKSGNTYIFGDGANWMSWEDLNKAGEGKRLEPKNYASYTLEWRWKFRGDNEHDTYLGNKAVHQDIKQIVIIYTTGTPSAGYEGYHHLPGVQTGDDTPILLYLMLALAACAGIFVMTKKRKRDEEQEEEDGQNSKE